MLRIGITGDNFIRWGGGLDFLRTVVSSLHATSVPMELHFLAPGTGPISALRRVDQKLTSVVKTVLGRKALASHTPSHADIKRAIESFDVPITLHDIDIGISALYRRSKKLSIDVLLPSFSPLPFDSELPWVGYLYDFQHRHLPQFFTDKECCQRDHDFQSMLASARAVIVNANDVKKDIEHFFPDSNARVFTLPFSTAPSPDWLDLNAASVREYYGIPPRYFIISNQFWQHKDHATAFNAFAELAQNTESSDVALVCTGATSDYRSMDYFNGLLEVIRLKRLESRVHILGMIPKSDQIALMTGAIALIQPTLNEGGPGGGAVYDAVALGVPSIVSNIPVNLEITEERSVSFFRARDPSSLAQAMRVSLEASQCRPRAAELIQRGKERRLRCGDVLMAALDYVTH